MFCRLLFFFHVRKERWVLEMSTMLSSDSFMFMLPVEYEVALCFFHPGKALTCLCARVRVPHPLCSAWHRSWVGGGNCSPVFAGAWCYTTASTAVEEHPCYPHPQLKVLLSWRATSCISARKLVPQCLRQLCSSPSACLHQWFKHCWWKLMGKI